jgi:hypothetical protein
VIIKKQKAKIKNRKSSDVLDHPPRLNAGERDHRKSQIKNQKSKIKTPLLPQIGGRQSAIANQKSRIKGPRRA